MNFIKIIIHWLRTNTELKLSYKFTTNFPPVYRQTNMSKIYLKFMQKIILNSPRWNVTKQFCKNFLVLLCVLNHWSKKIENSTNYISSTKMFLYILPQTKTHITLLKAPFVNKLTKKHYCLHRYFFLVSFSFILKNFIKFENSTQLLLFTRLILKHLLFFESNICTNYNIRLSYKFTLS